LRLMTARIGPLPVAYERVVGALVLPKARR
jgi:hypothetical protein